MIHSLTKVVLVFGLFFCFTAAADAATTTARFYAGSGDGVVGIGTFEAQATWADARSYSGAVTYIATSSVEYSMSRSDKVGDVYRIYRGSLPFDTSSIPNNAVIQSASLHLYGTSSYGYQESAVCITTHDREDMATVVGDDYHIDTHGSTSLAPASTLTNDQYNVFELDSNGIAHINPADNTAFSVRTAHDCDNTDPGVGIMSAAWNSSEAAGTSTDPYLEVTYTVAPVTISVYPTDDGFYFLYDEENQTVWSSARNYSSTFARSPNTTATSIGTRSDKGSGKFRFYRLSMRFDTSSIPEGATIEAASLKAYKDPSGNNTGTTPLVFTGHTRASSTSFTKSDWILTNFGTEFARGLLADSQYTTYTFNTTGKNYINTAGDTTIGGLTSFDYDNVAQGSPTKTASFYSSEATGTNTDPYLEITYLHTEE